MGVTAAAAPLATTAGATDDDEDEEEVAILGRATRVEAGKPAKDASPADLGLSIEVEEAAAVGVAFRAGNPEKESRAAG